MPSRSVLRVLLCGAALLLLPTAHARAQELTRAEIAQQNQILELHQEIEALRAQNQGGNPGGNGDSSLPQPQYAPQSQTSAEASPSGAPDLTAQLLDRVSRLEDQVRTLQGNVDELRNGLQQQNADLSKQISDLTFRVQALEGNGGAAAPATADAASAPPLRAAPPARPLEAAQAALARRDYKAAETAARTAIADPHTAHTDDARFILAQALAGRREYQQAALAFDDTYSKQRRGPHAADSLVGLASALASLGDKPAACASLGKLQAEFPSAGATTSAHAAAVARRAGCH
jgi:TolA-binding protein